MNSYDLIIIGAGPCGVMAAIQATKNHKKVLLIEKNSEILRKLSISGNSRCNLTNNKEFKDFINQLSNKKFLYSTIKQFDAQAVINYFTSLNVALKEENDNRIFPTSNKSSTIINALIKQLNKTDIILNTMVKDIKKGNNLFIVKANQQVYQAKNLLLACGGQTYPQLGVGVDAYLLAKKFNHTTTPLVIEECPIKTTPIMKEWQGITLNKVTINIIADNKSYLKVKDSIIFTHFGLSGPAILNSSFMINKLCNPIISLNMLNMDYEDAKKIIYDLVNTYPKKYLRNQLIEYLPQKIINGILNNLDIFDTKNSYLNKQQLKNLINFLTNLRLTFKSFYQPEYAFLTGSGINLNEINSKTLESKLVKNLYFGGEILDGCGPLGGYNITIALACGHLVGNNIK